MPEYPDIELYLDALRRYLQGQSLKRVRLVSPFLLRSVEPSLSVLEGRRVESFERLGKRIVFGFEGELFLVLHLMIAGRLRWLSAGAAVPKRLGLAAFDFEPGTLLLTEAGKKKRASLHAVRGRAGLAVHDPGGAVLEELNRDDFADRLTARNHTLKRSLTDPKLFSGIGNAYSDEILHRARLSPIVWTSRLSEAEIDRLYEATLQVLEQWKRRLIEETGDGFPEKVTAFRKGMAAHGRYGKPCPVCGDPIQRIVYADNEVNYCPTCQTDGKLLADRALSRLLGKDWPRSLDALDELRSR